MNYSFILVLSKHHSFIVDFSKYRTYTCGKITFRGFPDIHSGDEYKLRDRMGYIV